MTLEIVRSCPLCGGKPKGISYPYVTQFNDTRFTYFSCRSCKSVYVDPVPNGETFAKMYAKSDYHDQHYNIDESAEYGESAQLLSKHLSPNSIVLDYGCGVGNFLKACKSHGLLAFGVEFDRDAAQFAARNGHCEAVSVEEFLLHPNPAGFDAIHLGDVLEHLPDPLDTIKGLLRFLKPGGVLFLEGPLENNPSPVFWVARGFGAAKRLVKASHLPRNAPTHLLRANGSAQQQFILRLGSDLTLSHWQIYETGWPYARGGQIKRCVAALAKAMGGRKIAGVTFGNRFKAILVKS